MNQEDICPACGFEVIGPLQERLVLDGEIRFKHYPKCPDHAPTEKEKRAVQRYLGLIAGGSL